MRVASGFGESIEAHDLVVRINYATAKGAKRSIGRINLGPIAMNESGSRRPRARSANPSGALLISTSERRGNLLNCFGGFHHKVEAGIWP